MAALISCEETPTHKLHHPWTGPYQVLKQILEATNRIMQVDGKRQCKVVHFNRLKPCPSNIQVKVNTNKATNNTQKNVEQSSEPVDSEQCQVLGLAYSSLMMMMMMVPSIQCMHNNQLLCHLYPHLEGTLRDTNNPPARYNDFVSHS